MAWWIAALVVGAAPRRVWSRLDPRLPLASTAPLAGVITLTIGFAVGVPAFLTFATGQADLNNAWMLHQLGSPTAVHAEAAPLVPYGMSVLALFIFLFFTPIGLFSLYLVVSGGLRAVAAWLDDPRGDFVLSGVHWAVTTIASKNREDRRRIARERLVGAETPDVLQTGAWAGLDADYVVLAARRKPEWDPGAVILTTTDWYRLGAAFDVQTPFGVRTAYPLTKLDTVDVIRRGIQYELPRLARRPNDKGTPRPLSPQN